MRERSVNCFAGGVCSHNIIIPVLNRDEKLHYIFFFAFYLDEFICAIARNENKLHFHISTDKIIK